MRTTHWNTHAPPSVHYGSLKIPLAAQRDVDAAFAYLSRDPVERSLIERVERSRIPHRIAIDHHGDDSYQPSTHTIRWDPHSALLTTGGGRQSPALGLGHELDHAAENPRAYDRLQDTYDYAFDSAEERRVIVGSERHAALTLHESIRRDHDGALYRVPAPVLR
jgi:hypothetical protein